MQLQEGEKTLLFYKYFFLNLVIFLIPFITISFFVYHEATKIIKKEIIAANVSKLEQVKDISDTRIKDMKSIATNISTDHKMTPYMLTKPYESILAIQQLINYAVNNSSIDGLFLYMDDHPYIYTSSGTATFDTYVQKTFGLSRKEMEDFRQDVQENNEPVFKKHQLSSSNQHIISHIYPISPGDGSSYGRKVVFLMKEKTYHSLVQHALGNSVGTNYILDHNNNLITVTKNEIPVSIPEIKQLASQGQKVIHKKLAGEDYSIVHVRSDLTGWTFITAMPTRQFFGKLNDLQQTIIYILTAIAIIGIIIISIVARRQYKPLQNLVKLLKSKHIIDLSHSAQKDELTRIRESILYMTDTSEKLHEKIELQAPYVKDQLLLQLLNGNMDKTKELKGLLADVNVSFKSNHVFVVLISKRGRDKKTVNHLGHESLYAKLQKIDFKNSVGYGVELPDDNGFGIIVSVDERNVQHHYQEFIDKLMEKITMQTHLTCSIGVGNIYTELDKINRSFIEAKAANEYANITNQGSCIYFENIAAQESSASWFPLQLQVKLSQSLKQGDYVVANETLKEILNHSTSIQTSIYMTKAMAYDLINSLLKVIVEQNLLYDVAYIKQLFKFQTIDELYNTLDKIAVYICKEMNQKKRNKNNHLCQKMMEYLQKEFTNPELSLEKLADYFNLSVPYASRFIKEQTGYTFTQIIWDMRMKECKRLLLDTSIPIKDIVFQVGYYDVANFTRKFKKSVGVTPGQYRKHRIDTAL